MFCIIVNKARVAFLQVTVWVATDKGNDMGIIVQSNDVIVSPSGPGSSTQECVREELGPSVYIPDVESTTIGRCWKLE